MIKEHKNLFILSIFLIVFAFFLFNLENISIFINDNILIRNNPIEVDNTPGVEPTIITGDVITGVIDTPENIRDYIDRVIKDGIAGFDYIIVSPSNQPNLSSSMGSENNNIMHSYLYKNRNIFTIPDNKKEGYIMFVTQKRVSNDKNIFISLDGSTIGWLNKDYSLEKANVKSNEYLYKLSVINLIGNNNYKFSKSIYDEMKENKISINAVVGESNNKVEKIIIFFK